MKTLKEIFSGINESVDIRLFVVGRTGQGKSTLINSIIELEKVIAAEGAKANTCTTKPQSYFFPSVVPGVNITLIDTPGLQDIHGKEQNYIHQMKKECPEVSLVLYCMSMVEQRLTNDDIIALQTLHQAFGPKFLERVIVVLCKANLEDNSIRDDRDEDDVLKPPFEDKEACNKLYKKRFIHRVELYAEAVKNTLFSEHAPEVIPVGSYKISAMWPDPMCLPDRENWLHDLLQLCYQQIKSKHKLSKLRLNNCKL